MSATPARSDAAITGAAVVPRIGAHRTTIASLGNRAVALLGRSVGHQDGEPDHGRYPTRHVERDANGGRTAR
jgi:hypothetical protein